MARFQGNVNPAKKPGKSSGTLLRRPRDSKASSRCFKLDLHRWPRTSVKKKSLRWQNTFLERFGLIALIFLSCFSTGRAQPLPLTSPASNIENNEAILNGIVNPEG